MAVAVNVAARRHRVISFHGSFALAILCRDGGAWTDAKSSPIGIYAHRRDVGAATSLLQLEGFQPANWALRANCGSPAIVSHRLGKGSRFQL